MWQRFNEPARIAIFRSQEAAKRFNSPLVDTEHLLLGLLFEEKYVASPGQLQVFIKSGKFEFDDKFIRLLGELGVNIRALKDQVESLTKLNSRFVRNESELSLSPRGKRVIDLTYDEMRNLNDNFIGSEHLLLGLVREHDGIAAQELRHAGVKIESARRALLSL